MCRLAKIPKILREIIEGKEKASIRRVAKAIAVDHGSLYRALKIGAVFERERSMGVFLDPLWSR